MVVVVGRGRTEALVAADSTAVVGMMVPAAAGSSTAVALH